MNQTKQSYYSGETIVQDESNQIIRTKYINTEPEHLEKREDETEQILEEIEVQDQNKRHRYDLANKTDRELWKKDLLRAMKNLLVSIQKDIDLNKVSLAQMRLQGMISLFEAKINGEKSIYDLESEPHIRDGFDLATPEGRAAWRKKLAETIPVLNPNNYL